MGEERRGKRKKRKGIKGKGIRRGRKKRRKQFNEILIHKLR